jgi:hypothetical protein
MTATDEACAAETREASMLFKALVNNGPFGTDEYATTRATVAEAKVWLDFIVNTKAMPSTNWITLQIGDMDESFAVTYRAIVTINNPIAYVRAAVRA